MQFAGKQNGRNGGCGFDKSKLCSHHFAEAVCWAGRFDQLAAFTHQRADTLAHGFPYIGFGGEMAEDRGLRDADFLGQTFGG